MPKPLLFFPPGLPAGIMHSANAASGSGGWRLDEHAGREAGCRLISRGVRA
jgi:hypothetical protein